MRAKTHIRLLDDACDDVLYLLSYYITDYLDLASLAIASPQFAIRILRDSHVWGHPLFAIALQSVMLKQQPCITQAMLRRYAKSRFASSEDIDWIRNASPDMHIQCISVNAFTSDVSLNRAITSEIWRLCYDCDCGVKPMEILRRTFTSGCILHYEGPFKREKMTRIDFCNSKHVFQAHFEGERGQERIRQKDLLNGKKVFYTYNSSNVRQKVVKRV